jgi:hypothetical protein
MMPNVVVGAVNPAAGDSCDGAVETALLKIRSCEG